MSWECIGVRVVLCIFGAASYSDCVLSFEDSVCASVIELSWCEVFGDEGCYHYSSVSEMFG